MIAVLMQYALCLLAFWRNNDFTVGFHYADRTFSFCGIYADTNHVHSSSIILQWHPSTSLRINMASDAKAKFQPA